MAAVRFALNHIVAPRLRFARLAGLARELGAADVELRDDLPGVEIADGTPASGVREQAAAAGVGLLTINALQRFDLWDDAREAEARALSAYARDCGARALVLCPTNDRADRRDETRRRADLERALAGLRPILSDHGLTGLVEPLGFEGCALRRKRAAVDAMDAVGAGAVFAVLHDTFHHHLAGEDEIFPERTGLVHISGVDSPYLARSGMRDAHRVLVGPGDRLGNVEQIEALLRGGYAGPFSFEPFAESVHALDDPAAALRESMALIRDRVAPAPAAERA